MAKYPKKNEASKQYSDLAKGEVVTIEAPAPKEEKPVDSLVKRVNDEMDSEYGWIQRGDVFSITKAVLRELVMRRLSNG